MRNTSLVYGIALALVAVGCQSAPQESSAPAATQTTTPTQTQAPSQPGATATNSSLQGVWKSDFTGNMKKVHDDVVKSGKKFETELSIDATMHFKYSESLMDKTQTDEGTVKLEGDKITLTSTKAGGTAPKEWKVVAEYLYLMPDGEKNGARLKK